MDGLTGRDSRSSFEWWTDLAGVCTSSGAVLDLFTKIFFIPPMVSARISFFFADGMINKDYRA